MNQIESNIVESFKNVKEDILEIKDQLLKLAENQARVESSFSALQAGKKAKLPVCKPKAKTFVAAKEGKKFHIRECPYAKNIKPKSKLSFKSKDVALNQGFKPCSCVK